MSIGYLLEWCGSAFVVGRVFDRLLADLSLTIKVAFHRVGVEGELEVVFMRTGDVSGQFVAVSVFE